MFSFSKIDIEFQKGLVVFSGASGAGKSILMNSMINLFSSNETKSKISEVSIENIDIENESYDIHNDEFVIKQLTATKTRYFLNNQSIPKKELNLFSKQFFKHLHLKDTSDFDSLKIVEFLDFLSMKKDKHYKNILNNYKTSFKELKDLKNSLAKIIQDETNIEDLKDLVTIQIDKIENINPINGEYEELKDLKNIISKKEKLDEVLLEIKPFLENSYKVSKALEIINTDSSFFDETINEINSLFENFYDKINSYEDTNIEDTLTRIEDLSNLIKKYGSINEALEFKEKKKKELEAYENISFEKEILLKNIKILQSNITKEANLLTTHRIQSLEILKKDMNKYLKYLYLDNLDINISTKHIDINGQDIVEFTLHNIELNKISSGEFNRLRLALLTARSLYEINTNGILFLDEIDANLSGKESQSIAKVLEVLSKHYQIFAISHQPQLSATANQHFLVSKTNNHSTIKELNKEQRIDEISRMISGEDITNEAKEFAKQLLT
jgi:DNA repair protein RecN (Recombination protein N)